MKTRDGYILIYEDGFEWENNPRFPPGWKEYPFVYDTLEKAVKELAETQIDLWEEVRNGAREIDEVWDIPSVHSVTVHEDGAMTSEDFDYEPVDIQIAAKREGRDSVKKEDRR